MTRDQQWESQMIPTNQALEEWLSELRNEGSPHADDLDHALMLLAQATDRIKDIAAKCGGAV